MWHIHFCRTTVSLRISSHLLFYLSRLCLICFLINSMRMFFSLSPCNLCVSSPLSRSSLLFWIHTILFIVSRITSFQNETSSRRETCRQTRSVSRTLGRVQEKQIPTPKENWVKFKPKSCNHHSNFVVLVFDLRFTDWNKESDPLLRQLVWFNTYEICIHSSLFLNGPRSSEVERLVGA